MKRALFRHKTIVPKVLNVAARLMPEYSDNPPPHLPPPHPTFVPPPLSEWEWRVPSPFRSAHQLAPPLL